MALQSSISAYSYIGTIMGIGVGAWMWNYIHKIGDSVFITSRPAGGSGFAHGGEVMPAEQSCTTIGNFTQTSQE
jgi:hypothetical protein